MAATQAISLDSRVSVSTEQVSSELEGEVIILNLAAGAYHGLDQIGARIWQLIQRPERVADVRDALLAEYDVSPQRCERDLLQLLNEMAEVGLLTRYDRAVA